MTLLVLPIRYYDLRMNVVPLFTDRKEASSIWHDTIHPWVDPSIKIRFLEIDDKYWFIHWFGFTET